MDIVKTYIAGENIAECMPVKLNSDGEVVKVTAITDKVVGVTERSVTDGNTVDVKHFGIGYVQTDGATAGDRLIPKANGKAQGFALSSFSEIAEHTVVYTIGTALDSDANAYYAKVLINPSVAVVPYVAPAVSEAPGT